MGTRCNRHLRTAQNPIEKIAYIWVIGVTGRKIGVKQQDLKIDYYNKEN